MNFSNKQLDIINATIRLLNSGKDLNKITVQEIADFAGIGKGSIYDHFKSKDEILNSTIIKKFSDGFIELHEVVKQNLEFRDKVFAFYDLLIADIKSQSSLSILNLICTAGNFYDIAKLFKQTELSFSSDLRDIITHIITQGITEKKITAPNDILYVEMVIFSNLSTLSRFITATFLGFENYDENIIKENAYRLLLKALN